MSRPLHIGVLSFHGDVSEHIAAVAAAAVRKKIRVDTSEVRTKDGLQNLNALIIPGGESTTLQMLCEREGMFPAMRKIKNIFGTCAGAILLAKKVHNKKKGQRTLALMDIEVDRNAYGRQIDSSEVELQTELGKIHATFIRAPKIHPIGRRVRVLAQNKDEIVCCEERINDSYYLAAAFHPELTTTLFHEYFLKQVSGATSRD